MQIMNKMKELINIYQFINPFEKIIEDTNKDIINVIVSRYAKQENLAETNKEMNIISVITVSQAQKACRILRLHEK